MKLFTILAVTGGLFFTSAGLNSKHAKNSKVCVKTTTVHCIKKCCNNAKKVKSSSAHTVVKSVITNS